jgi:hypothetical protein
VTGSRPKPLVYLAIILPLLAGGGFLVVLGLTRVFAASRGIAPAAIPDRNGMLIALPALFLWIPVALLLGNLLLLATPPLRRIAEGYQEATRTLGFGASQRNLGRFAMATAVVAIPLIALGFWL